MFKTSYVGRLLSAIYPRCHDNISTLDSDVRLIRLRVGGLDGADWVGSATDDATLRACFDIRTEDKFGLFAESVKRSDNVRVGVCGGDVIISDMAQNMFHQRSVKIQQFGASTAAPLLRALFPAAEPTFGHLIGRARASVTRSFLNLATPGTVAKSTAAASLVNPATGVAESVSVETQKITTSAIFVEQCHADDSIRARLERVAGLLGCVAAKGDYPIIISYNSLAKSTALAVRNVRYLWMSFPVGPYTQDYLTTLNKAYTDKVASMNTPATWANRVATVYDAGPGIASNRGFVVGLPITDYLSEQYDWVMEESLLGLSWGTGSFQVGATATHLLQNGANGPAVSVDAIATPFGTWLPPQRGGPLTALAGHFECRYLKAVYEAGPAVDEDAGLVGLGDAVPALNEFAYVPGSSPNSMLMRPLIGAPAGLEFAFRGRVTGVENEAFVHPGFLNRTITIKTISFAANTVCYGVPYAWYTEYLATGFGLYKPLTGDALTKALADSSDLAGAVVCCVAKSPGYDAGGGLIEQSLLYKDYKSAREKACQANNFYETKYDSGRTWADIRTAMNKQPVLSDLYGIRFSSATTATLQDVTKSTLTWIGGKLDAVSAVTAGETKWTLVYTDGGGVAAPLTLQPEAISEAYANGLQITANAKIALDSLFGADTWNECVNSAAMAMVLGAEAAMGRGTTHGGYDFSWENLGKSGYPILDNLPAQVRGLAAIVSVADYQVIGRPLRAVVAKFGASIVAQKAAVKP